MVARIRIKPGVRVTFVRDGAEIDTAVAATGERALKAAIVMLAGLDHLQNGDRLVVMER